MSEELFDIFDSENIKCLGQVKRSVVHKEGIIHRAVNVILQNNKNEILLQKRSSSKLICPSKWDLSCAEHLQPNESYINAAKRGLKEELNIKINDIIRIRKDELFCIDDDINEIHDHEFTECYFAKYNGNIQIDDIEVSEAKYFTIEKVKKWIAESPNDFTPWALKDLKIYLKI